MGYILFLTKHHDGFCLWDTKTTDRKVTKAPLGRDVLAELRKSCDKHGIKLALYFSLGEFADNKDYHPGGYTPDMQKAQLKELGYHRTQQFAIEWKDGGVWKELARGTTIAGEKEIAFRPVTARHVRLNILKATEVPTIEEFDLYPPSPTVRK